MQQGVSPVNCLSFVAVGHLFSVFPFLDNYFLVSIDKKYQFFFGGGVDFITSQVLLVIEQVQGFFFYNYYYYYYYFFFRNPGRQFMKSLSRPRLKWLISESKYPVLRWTMNVEVLLLWFILGFQDYFKTCVKKYHVGRGIQRKWQNTSKKVGYWHMQTSGQAGLLLCLAHIEA